MAAILVDDDYSVSRRVLAHTLQKDGHMMIMASAASEALQRLTETKLDLAILDIAMPGTDGLTLLKAIRADRRFTLLPAIMLSASGEDHHRDEARRSGANDFLSKPSSSLEILKTVGRLLG